MSNSSVSSEISSSTAETLEDLSESLESEDEKKNKEYITVKMKGFKFYRRTKTFYFPRYKTTYICGNNGSGKSSIYRAIQWAIFPKKNDKVHPFGTNKQVYVKVSFGSDLTITRTATPGTIQVTYGGNKYKSEDAEVVIAKLFNSSKIYKTCVSRNTCVHPFINATAPQRVEMLNEMIGNKEQLKKKLAAKFSAARSETDKVELSYTKERTRYKTLHKGEKLNESLILDKEKTETLNDSLTILKKTIKEGECFLKKLDTLKARKLQLSTTLAKYKSFNEDELEELSKQRKLCNEYVPVEEKLDSIFSKLEKALFSSDSKNKNHLKVPILSEENFSKVIVTENIYKQYSKKAKELGVVYEEFAINKKKKESELCIHQEAAFKEYYQYKEIESEVNKAKSKVVKLQLDNTTLNCNISTNSNVSDILKQIDTLELSLSYQPLWQKHQSYNELKKKLHSCSQKSVTSCGDVAQLKVRVKELKEILSYEKTLILRAKYESKWSSMSNKYVETNDWYQTSKLPQKVRERSEELTKTFNEIKLSESVIKCPHCDGCVRIINGKLVKYEGQIVKLNKQNLEQEIKALNELSTLSYPTVPEEIREVNMKNIETEKTQLEYVIELLTQLKTYDNLEALAVDYLPPTDKARMKIKFLKSLLVELEKYSNVKVKFDAMECPILKPNLSLADIEKAKAFLLELNKVVVVNLNEYSSEVYKLRAEHDKLKTKLSSLIKPSKIVTEQDIIRYTTSLQAKKQSQKDLEEVKDDMDKITWNSDKLERVKQEINDIETPLTESIKQSAILENYNKLQKVKNKRKKKKLNLQNLEDFKRIFEKDCKACISNTLLSIQYTTNEFLEMLTDVRILLTIDNNIKIECIKDGFNCGSIKELSDGEASLVSFGLNIAFALQSDSDLLILDEVTDKLSPINKDACIEILFDIMSKNKKTLILTDHHHHNGDYDNILELGKKVKLKKKSDIHNVRSATRNSK